MAKKEIDTAAYVDKYSDEGLMSKVKRVGKKMGGEESSSTAIIQALSPEGETVSSKRHNQSDSESIMEDRG